MEKQTLIIEVGDRITKVATVSKRGQTSSLHKSMFFETPPQSVLDGQVTQPEVFANALNENLAKNQMTEAKSVIFVLASPKIVSRKIHLPPVKERQIASVILANASTYFPIDLANYQICHTMLENVEGDKPGFKLMVMAVPKQLMAAYEKLAEIAGLSIQSFDTVANTQYQLFHDLNVSGVTMFLSLGSRQSLVTFMQNNALLLQHAMPFGGDEYLNLAMSAIEKNEDKYSFVLNNSEIPSWVADHIPKQRFDDISNRFSSAVTRLIDFFKSSNRNMDIDRIILVDTCCGISGIKKALATSTSIEVYSIEEISGYNSIVTGAKVGFNIAIASALVRPLDLLPMSDKKGGSLGKRGGVRKKSAVSATMTFFVGFIVLSIGVTAYSAIYYFISASANSAAQKELDSLSYVQESYDLYIEYQMIRQSFEQLEQQAVNKNADLRAFLEELEQKMPTRLLLLSASCDEFGVTLNITTSTMEDAATTLKQLRTFESIKQIEIGGVSEAVDDTGLSVVSFSVVCSYDPPIELQQPSLEGDLTLEGEMEQDLEQGLEGI